MTFLEGKVLICQRPNRNGFLSGFEVLEVETDGVGNRLLVWFEPSLTLKSQYPERITQVESVSPFTSDLPFDSDKFLVGCGFGFKVRLLERAARLLAAGGRSARLCRRQLREKSWAEGWNTRFWTV